MRLKFAEIDSARLSQYVSFIEQLNISGAQGYRLISAVNSIGLVRFDEGEYEYSWFATGSDLFFRTTGFGHNYDELSKQGFRLVDRFVISKTCETDSFNQDTCDVKELFIVEREKSVEKPTHHVLVTTFPSWKGDRSLELSAQINEKIREGYYPVRALSLFEILLEQTEKNDEPASGKPDVQVVRSTLGLRDDAILRKKVDQLANQGYGLVSLNRGIAVMYRRGDTATPVSYVWLETKNKGFEKHLAQLQARGAVYRIYYPDDVGRKTTLIFEQKAVDDGTRHEYRVLKLELDETADAAEKKTHINLTSSSKEAIKLMNGLVKEGFAVRELFVTDTPSILLER